MVWDAGNRQKQEKFLSYEDINKCLVFKWIHPSDRWWETQDAKAKELDWTRNPLRPGPAHLHAFIHQPIVQAGSCQHSTELCRPQRQEHEGLPRASDIWHVNERTSSGHLSGRQFGNYNYTTLWPPQYPIENISFELKAGLCKYLAAQVDGPQSETTRRRTNQVTAGQKWTASPEKLVARRVWSDDLDFFLSKKIKLHSNWLSFLEN